MDREQRKSAGREWIGGRFAAPFHITERPEPYRPTFAAWIEAPEGVILAYDLCKPGEERGALGRALTDAMQHPLVGPARRPSRIRVADAELADEVKAVVGDMIPVTIAPTPELDDVLDSMSKSMTAGKGLPADAKPGREEESYFENGRVSPTAVADLFAAASLLRLVAPWKVASDQQVLRLDIPELGVNGAAVSIIGAAGENFGILIFPSLKRFDAFLKVASDSRRKARRMDLGTSFLSFSLVPRGELPVPMQTEVDTHGWSVADPMSYPQVEHRDRDGLLRPLTEKDVQIASSCATSFCAFFIQNREAFESDYGEPICASFTDDAERTVRFTLPYEAFSLFDVGTDPLPPSQDSRRSTVGRNDPCHCGSGKKYKQCHLDEDRARE